VSGVVRIYPYDSWSKTSKLDNRFFNGKFFHNLFARKSALELDICRAWIQTMTK
jgi:hypothetical protein